MRRQKSLKRWPLVAVLGALAVAACTGPTPYQARVDEYGYANQRLDNDTFRVSFSGNSATDREVVEAYLLYRAAEVTLEAGYDHFVVVADETERLDRFRTTGIGGFPYYRGGFGCCVGGFGGGGLGLGGGFNDSTTRNIPRYEAMATIRLGRGQKPNDTSNAYNARELIQNLQGDVIRPDDLSV